MVVWSGCRLELRDSGDQIVFQDDDCDVRLDSGRILVSWFDDEGPVVFAGPDDGAGVFELVCRSRARRGRLTLQRERARLEGVWFEDGETGAWHIELGELAD